MMHQSEDRPAAERRGRAVQLCPAARDHSCRPWWYGEVCLFRSSLCTM